MELVVLSGKGGTGKTTIVAAFSELAKDVMKIDCDVDAPNLYLFYKGKDIKKDEFKGGKKAIIEKELCVQCLRCETVCKFQAISNFTIDSFICEGCGACTLVCPQNAIELVNEKTADTFITQLDKGVISRAQMEVGSDGSGKLITYLRKAGKEYNKNQKLTLIDGSPGIGCSVISSITGSDAVLIVTEPTKSGLEDLKRVVSLSEHFGVSLMVCINKYDINLEVTNQIQEFINEKQIILLGKVPYDDTVMKAVNELKPITFYKDSLAAKAIKNMWNQFIDLKIYKEEF